MALQPSVSPATEVDGVDLYPAESSVLNIQQAIRDRTWGRAPESSSRPWQSTRRSSVCQCSSIWFQRCVNARHETYCGCNHPKHAAGDAAAVQTYHGQRHGGDKRPDLSSPAML